MNEKKLAIMQPYFLPYLGYFQLMNEVDEFVVYDNIQFTKKGWIHRNRILENGEPTYISLPLKKDSDYLNVNDRYLSDIFSSDRVKQLAKIRGAYLKAPYFHSVFPLIENIYQYSADNLFDFVLNSILEIKNYLNIETDICISSSIGLNKELKAQERVIAICQARNATHYINPEGGKELYNKSIFENHKLSLHFHYFQPNPYQQFSEDFKSHLSILDVLMFCSTDELKGKLLNDFRID